MRQIDPHTTRTLPSPKDPLQPPRRRGGWQRARPGRAERGRLWLIAIGIVVAAGVVRLAFAAATPLVPDETYYWEWSRRLAAGYFDHPPAIALLVAAGTALFGDTPLGVRFFSVLAGVGTLLVVVGLARRHGGARAALRAAVLTSCVPLAAAGFVLATPDAPLLLAFALGLSALDRAVAAESGSRGSYLWWLLAGAAVGLGLLSKYTAVLLPLAVLVALLFRPSLRVRLRGAEPYLAALVALVVFSPVVYWNARHDWASFAFQLRQGFGGGGGSLLARQLELLGYQLGLASPLLFGLAAAAVYLGLRRRTGERRFLLATAAAVTFGFFAYTALRHRVEPNWPAPAYLPAFVLLALVAGRHPWRRWLRAGSALGAALVVLVYAQTLQPVLPLSPEKDPMARAHGWDSLARAVLAVQERERARAGGAVWIAANRYQDASQLAFHLPGNPAVFALNRGGRPNQYDFWPGFVERARPGDPLILVLDERHDADPVVQALRAHFDRVRRGGLVELRRAREVVAQRRVWVFEGWHGSWPGAQ